MNAQATILCATVVKRAPKARFPYTQLPSEILVSLFLSRIQDALLRATIRESVEPLNRVYFSIALFGIVLDIANDLVSGAPVVRARGFKENEGATRRVRAFKTRARNQISITYRGYQSHKWGYNECDNIKH